MEDHQDTNSHGFTVGNGQNDDASPIKKSTLPIADKPLLIHEEGRIVRKAVKGHIDSADIKRSLNLQDDPQINHVTCN
jgi:hypothetical protein